MSDEYTEFDPNQTQPTWAVRREPELTQTPITQAKVEDKKAEPKPQNPNFGIGSLALLLILVWVSEGIGASFPGPIDDILYDTIAALFFGLVQYLRLKLPLLDQYLRQQLPRLNEFLKLKGSSIWQELGKKYPKFANRLSYYFGGAEDQFKEEYE